MSAAVGAPRARPRPATTADSAAVATAVGKVGAEVGNLGVETRRIAALSLLSNDEKEGVRTGEPRTSDQETAVLANFYNTHPKRPGWLQRQASKATTEKDYLTIAEIGIVNRDLGGRLFPAKTLRGNALATLIARYLAAAPNVQLRAAVNVGKKAGFNFVSNSLF